MNNSKTKCFINTAWCWAELSSRLSRILETSVLKKGLGVRCLENLEGSLKKTSAQLEKKGKKRQRSLLQYTSIYPCSIMQITHAATCLKGRRAQYVGKGQLGQNKQTGHKSFTGEKKKHFFITYFITLRNLVNTHLYS